MSSLCNWLNDDAIQLRLRALKMNQIFPPCTQAVNHEISFGHVVLNVYLRYPDRDADG